MVPVRALQVEPRVRRPRVRPVALEAAAQQAQVARQARGAAVAGGARGRARATNPPPNPEIAIPAKLGFPRVVILWKRRRGQWRQAEPLEVSPIPRSKI